LLFILDGIHDFNSLKYLSSLNDVIKITWLGYAGPTGNGQVPRAVDASLAHGTVNTTTINYMICDKIILPPDLPVTKYFSEKLIYLRGSYQPQDELQGSMIHNWFSDDSLTTFNDRTDRESRRKFFLHKILDDKSDLSYSWGSKHDVPVMSRNDRIWYICFNRLSKVTPDAFDDWMQIMSVQMKSILILMVKSPSSARLIMVSSYFLFLGHVDISRFHFYRMRPA